MARTVKQRSKAVPATDVVRVIELAYARRLDEVLKQTRVIDWADFLAEDVGTGRKRVVFGFQGSSIAWGTYNPIQDRPDAKETATFELQVEVHDLRNHEKALVLVRQAVWGALANYQPFEEVESLKPTSYGNPRFDGDKGFWVYSAEFITSFDPYAQLTPTEEAETTTITMVKLFNDSAEPGNDLVLSLPIPVPEDFR